MAKDSVDQQPSTDVNSVEAFIADALQDTRQRLQVLGVADPTLLDPEGSVDQQVAMLRLLFLEAERSCLPFNGAEHNYWRVLKARLQPVVLAYLTHEKFVQTLDIAAREMRPDTLLQVYKDRLSNSDRFRSFFFDLDKRLKQEAGLLFEAEDAPPPTKPKAEFSQANADMQKNVMAALEKQLQEMERKNSQQDKVLAAAHKKMAGLNSALEERDTRLAALEQEIARLEEQNMQLKLANDANGRSGRYQENDEDEVVILTGEETLTEAMLDADPQQLLLKIEGLERELATTSDAAYSAFMSNSDLGIIILFMLTSFKCHTHQQLAAELVKSVNAFGLKSVVGVAAADGYRFYPQTEGNEELVSQLNSRIPAAKKVEDPHLMLFEANCCILIQDPPRQDEERYARLVDNLGSLMRGVQARYEAILAESSVQKQKAQVDALIVRSHDVFQTFERNLDKQKDKLSRVINMLGQEMRKSLGIAPGDQNSIRLNMDLKKLEDAVSKLFVQSELVDPAFKKNISKVAENLTRKSPPPS
ncbi:hypothetical protein [Ketobacter sp.]|uniref:hypothetical protein n=1 Tax=Ketobacter sp. TaxID=2083498 RepID=UPI000F1E3EE1|nr:hypothetical protein [Ketobacter sp.]RLT93502.1 MAG: hypothetical protein D9N14_18560 [Ketobacter sp.]